MSDKPRLVTLEEQRQMGLRTGDKNFVAPLPADRTPTQEPVQAYPMAIVPHSPSNTTSVELRTTYRDRAEGFTTATMPVATVAGVLSGIVAIVGFSVPALSLAALVWIFAGFCITWLFAWFWFNLASPDGVALIHTALGWLFLFREQDYRNRGRK